MTNLSCRVSIGIPTRDRWDILRLTLTKLEEHGYSALDTMVIDDGTETPMPFDLAARFPWVRFLRFEKPAGVCARRNWLARNLSTPFMLYLDDDSFPIAGDLSAACDWLEAQPKALSLAFQICQSDAGPDPELTAMAPMRLRDFNGGGVLLRRDLFLSLGGFEEKFTYYLEEPELCMRALQQGYEMWGYPTFIVEHHMARSHRDIPGRVRMLLRKEALMALMFFPFPICYRRIFTCVPGFFYHNAELRPYWPQMIAGAIKGIGDYLSGGYKRRRNTPEEYRNWCSVPLATAVYRNAEITYGGSKGAQ